MGAVALGTAPLIAGTVALGSVALRTVALRACPLGPVPLRTLTLGTLTLGTARCRCSLLGFRLRLALAFDRRADFLDITVFQGIHMIMGINALFMKLCQHVLVADPQFFG